MARIVDGLASKPYPGGRSETGFGSTSGSVTPQKYPRIFIIKIIIYSRYNWANLGIFLGIVR